MTDLALLGAVRTPDFSEWVLLALICAFPVLLAAAVAVEDVQLNEFELVHDMIDIAC